MIGFGRESKFLLLDNKSKGRLKFGFDDITADGDDDEEEEGEGDESRESFMGCILSTSDSIYGQRDRDKLLKQNCSLRQKFCKSC
jgi:hypothetical protein